MMSEHRQGGDTRGLATGVIDLASCVNPYGPPPAAVAALQSLDVSTLRGHPYGASDDVLSAMSDYLGVSAEELTAGRGISGLLWALRDAARGAGLKVHVPRPAYTEFRDAFGLASTPSRTRLQVEDIEVGLADGAIVVIANPENASGVALPREALVDLAARFPRAWLVVDESYVDFVADPSALTLVGHAPPNVSVLRSISKFHGLAGVRVGVAWSNGRLPDLLAPAGPWPTSRIDAILLTAAVSDYEWVQESRVQLESDQRWLDQLLLEQGLRVVPGSRTQTRLIVGAPDDLGDRLLTQGIRVRALSTSHGLKPAGFRIVPPHSCLRHRVRFALRAALASVLPT